MSKWRSGGRDQNWKKRDKVDALQDELRDRIRDEATHYWDEIDGQPVLVMRCPTPHTIRRRDER